MWGKKALFVAAALTVGCSGSEEPVVGTLYAEPGQLSFGDVEVTKASTAVITVTTLENVPFEITSVTMRPLDQLTFDFNTDKKSAGEGESILIEVNYHPVGAGSSLVELVVVPAAGEPIILLVSGNAVNPAELRVAKQRFSFGTVTVGTSAMMSSTIENRNPTAGTVTFDPGLNVSHCDAPNSEFDNFCVTFEGKSLDSNGRFPIDPSETINFMVRFIPKDSGVREAASFTLSTCPEPMCEIDVELDGEGG